MIRSIPYIFALALIAPTTHADGDPDEFDQVNESLGNRGTPIQIVDPDSRSARKGFLTGIDVYASDKAAQLKLQGDGATLNLTDARLTIGFLFNEERDNIFTGGIALDAEPEFLPGLTLSLGGRAYAGLLGIENADVIGISMGLEASFDPMLDTLPLIFNGSVYYAPDILTFGQSDRIIDWQVDAALQLRESLTGYVGLRYLEFDTRPGEREVDDNVHAGLRWHFQ
ncbi:MAG: YfaZ family protein [Gammaproteobacteria bacterium]|nr:YfaZ family protein [Gammaproteobacteria bacterium]